MNRDWKFYVGIVLVGLGTASFCTGNNVGSDAAEQLGAILFRLLLLGLGAFLMFKSRG